MGILIAGPRVGKSTSLVIPALTAAPGAVVTTSNKRDVLDPTRDLRAQVGDVWVFDPQKVALEEPTWWWNPLTYVTDDTKAREARPTLRVLGDLGRSKDGRLLRGQGTEPPRRVLPRRSDREPADHGRVRLADERRPHRRARLPRRRTPARRTRFAPCSAARRSRATASTPRPSGWPRA
ncbi:type IV secretory system conjugative DNA transfer family protein [Rathayibacter caricis]